VLPTAPSTGGSPRSAVSLPVDGPLSAGGVSRDLADLLRRPVALYVQSYVGQPDRSCCTSDQEPPSRLASW
jgi:hypothetical protein